MPGADFTVRDVKFYTFVAILAKKAKWIKNNIAEPASINAELGYGGARLMDVRWTGLKSIEKLCECINYCNGVDLKLRVTGSSAGNVMAYSLAMILAVKGSCCGYDVKKTKRRGGNINRGLFYDASSLRIPQNIKCACEAVRIIADLLLVVVAVQEHPSWHDVDDEYPSSFAKEISGCSRHTIPANTIQEMFSGNETAESVLSFSRGTAASGFSDIFVEAPIQYVIKMYRAIDGLEGRDGDLYSLSRYLLLFCVTWDKEDEHVNPFFDRCEFYIGARKIVDDEGFVFTDLVGTDSVPLVNLISKATTHAVKSDVKRFNESVDILMDSIDVREIVLPKVARFIWRRVQSRLKLRNNKTIGDIKNWKWDGVVSSCRSYTRKDYEITERRQTASDIMTGSGGDYLPDFEKMIIDTTGVQDLLCWNYVFELSPLGKHLFGLERVSALIEASLPLITPFQMKVSQRRRGR